MDEICKFYEWRGREESDVAIEPRVGEEDRGTKLASCKALER